MHHRWAAGCLLAALCMISSARAADDARVEEMKRKAVETLRSINDIGLGQRAIVTLALLKADEPPGSPQIEGTIRDIVAQIQGGEYVPFAKHTDIYESSVALMVLAYADKEKYRPEIHAIAKYIVSKQKSVGGWDYPEGVNGDTSITQYAILGLWEATRCGVDVAPGVWIKTAKWHLSTQHSDGGFVYHPIAGHVIGGDGGTTHTMTVAGIASLYVCRLHLFPKAAGLPIHPEPEPEELPQKPQRTRPKYAILHPVGPDFPDDRIPLTAPGGGGLTTAPTGKLGGEAAATVTQAAIEAGIEKGTKWLEARWTANPDSKWKLYYLYGIERFAALSQKSDINGHDWYAEGTDALFNTQRDKGWIDDSGSGPATAFALMFLGKATAKMLNLPEKARRGKVGSGVLVGGRGLPANLNQLSADNGAVKARKLNGPVDELLAELEKSGGGEVEAAQAAIVEQVVLDQPESLIGQKDRLVKLVVDKRPEVRRTAYWALGRADDLTSVPLLINGLNDVDAACVIEAYAALRYISRRITLPDLPEEISAKVRDQQVQLWTKWYLAVRPYVERDDLQPEPEIGRKPASLVPKPGVRNP